MPRDLTAFRTEKNTEASSFCHLMGLADLYPSLSSLILCLRFMFQVGKQLEMKPASKKFVADYFENLKTLQGNRKLPTRIRFLVRDLIEMRANNWVPRREELKVTTTSNKASSLEAQFGLIPPKGMQGEKPWSF